MCVLGCSLHHAGQCNPALARLRVTRHPDRYAFAIQVCLHCSDPVCMAACVDEAMERDSRGIVSIIEERCVLCGSCQEACPYDAIFYDPERAAYLKCDLCRGRDGGPACVEVCPTGALALAVTAGAEE